MIRRRTLGRRGLRLRELDFDDVLGFLSAWRPPHGEFELSRARWKTWAEFFAEYEALRTELLASGWAHRKQPFAETEFAKWLDAGRPKEWSGPYDCDDYSASPYACDRWGHAFGKGS
jgi:hypothetical protein